MSDYIGDFLAGATVRFLWNTNDGAGGSVDRATNGTIAVYKDNGTTQDTDGVTDTEQFDALVGVHAVAIDLSADPTFYSAGSDFFVVLSAATIDGQTVNAAIRHFSIENRFGSLKDNAIAAAKIATGAITAAKFAAGAIDNAAIATDAIGSAELAAAAVNKIRDAILSDSTAFAGANIAAIKAKTDNLPSDPADQSLVIAATDAILAILGTPAGASLAADIAALLVAIGDVPTAAEAADALLGRNINGGSSAGRTVKQALKRLRNRVRNNAGTMEVYDENDTDINWSGALTTAAGNPISEVNPT